MSRLSTAAKARRIRRVSGGANRYGTKATIGSVAFFEVVAAGCADGPDV
jgi:hypothetical protein